MENNECFLTALELEPIKAMIYKDLDDILKNYMLSDKLNKVNPNELYAIMLCCAVQLLGKVVGSALYSKSKQELCFKVDEEIEEVFSATVKDAKKITKYVFNAYEKGEK